MPGYKGHLIAGSVTYLIIIQMLKAFNPSISLLLQGFIFCLLGSLFPDIDIKSKGQNLFYVVAFMILCLLLYVDRIDLFVIISFMLLVPLLVKHRGLFHQLWFLVAMSIILGFLIDDFLVMSSNVACKNSLFFLAGAISHVLLDRFITQIKYWITHV